jgi:hypothetical protein
MTQLRGKLGRVPAALRVLIWLFCLCALAIATYWVWDFIDDLIKDALEARFEAAPPEGFPYWYRREVLKAAVPIVLLIGPLVLGIALLLRAGWRWWKRS